MPDKLTDAEIVKALECCADIKDKCTECPLKDKNRESCVGILMSNALDLINCLQAQVKKCEKVEHFADKTIATLQAEIERLKKKKDEYAHLYDKHINTAFSHIKAEAYP